MKYLRESRQDYLWIIFGTLLMALATNLFYTPAQMVPGGFTGLAIIMQHVTQSVVPGGIPVWVNNIILNVPLILLAIRVRGWKFMRRTLLAASLFSLWLFVLPEYDMVQGDYLLTAVIGGAFMGAGLGYVFLGKATTGGTDTLAALFQKLLPHVSVAKILPYLDGVVILLSLWIFGLQVSLYAVITVVLCGRIADEVISGSKNAFLAYIISDQGDEIAARIMEEMERGVTRLSGTGMYTGSERTVLFCAVSKKQTALLKEIVWECDEKAFLVLNDAREVRGEGFLGYSSEEL